MARFTTFQFCLDPTVEQQTMLRRHAGASRFGYNQCVRLVKQALDAKSHGMGCRVPWSGFDLINAFNGWKTSADAGRVLVAAADGTTTVNATGLSWRAEVCQQVFEEAAVDLGRGQGLADRRTQGSGGGLPEVQVQETGTVVVSGPLQDLHRWPGQYQGR
ncbi:hypothetical protein Cme02nite_74750 [Catellatospora methionotrophica]|uniref:Transposase putative helix-turn-helix domain-containing protein n=1 Tax=Catellatospora methionotrophica TaxID=121620 RepID=A0A8J3PK38_9ACTN|nr:hypothetical protein Cme02nite_74750 [Catellatospora methionotrophica]